MKHSVAATVALVLVAGFGASLEAHPHHGNGRDDAPVPVVAEPQPARPSGAPLALLVVLAGVTGSAVAPAAMRATKLVPLGLLAAGIAVALVLAVGDSPAHTSEADDDKPQPRHDPEQLAAHFEHFKKDGVTFRAEGDHFFVESNAFPSRAMMVGITAWQQQVPLPQPYTGKNAWRIPLKPAVAAKPISAKSALFSGAIALAVDGVPIFNALNNRGVDAYLAGELDEYGGHCGRGDDYHYHAAPLHLEKVVGKGNPIAYALDGFPLHGTTDAAGVEPKNLDEFNGRFEADGRYRYYSTKTYPYINGGLRGVVTVRGDRVDPQPRDAPVRPAGEPLRGAKITEFVRDDEAKTYSVKYEVRGKTRSVKYTLKEGGEFRFVTTDENGTERAETFRRRDKK